MLRSKKTATTGNTGCAKKTETMGDITRELKVNNKNQFIGHEDMPDKRRLNIAAVSSHDLTVVLHH